MTPNDKLPGLLAIHKFRTFNHSRMAEFRTCYAVLYDLSFEFPMNKIFRRIHIDIRVPRMTAIFTDEIPSITQMEKITSMSLNYISIRVIPRFSILNGNPFGRSTNA